MQVLAFADPPLGATSRGLIIAGLTFLILAFVFAGALAIAAKMRHRKEDA